MADEKNIEDMSPQEIAELQKKNCIFCKIASKEIPAKIIQEDNDIICILDINPASEGHVLVYPKKHYMIVPHLPDDLLSKLFSTVKLISNKLLTALQCAGTTVFIANGSAAGQKAPHVLIHVFPRRENDGLVKLPNYEMNDEQVEKLKKELKPYFKHVFGKGTSLEEKEEKPKKREEKVEKNKDNDADDSEEDELPQVKESDAKDAEKIARKPAKKEEPAGSNMKKTTGVSLDDIGKLFGA
ncbi:MAG TPA: HIT domain-containing protein [Alphaproteobacteria bacterium]|nr:HIT domain-containing protein [Alphaproteobacteria bacterium]